METAMRCLGGLILLLWLFALLPRQRRWLFTILPSQVERIQQPRSLLRATIFQLNILPFLLGLGLLITAQPLLILLAAIAFFLSRVRPAQTSDNFTLILPMICGGYCGDYLLTSLVSSALLWHIVGIISGIICMYGLMSGIVAVTSFLPAVGTVEQGQQTFDKSQRQIERPEMPSSEKISLEDLATELAQGPDGLEEQPKRILPFPLALTLSGWAGLWGMLGAFWFIGSILHVFRTEGGWFFVKEFLVPFSSYGLIWLLFGGSAAFCPFWIAHCCWMKKDDEVSWTKGQLVPSAIFVPIVAFIILLVTHLFFGPAFPIAAE